MNEELKQACAALLHCLDKRVSNGAWASPLRQMIGVDDQVADLWQAMRANDEEMAVECALEICEELAATRSSSNGDTCYAECWNYDVPGLEKAFCKLSSIVKGPGIPGRYLLRVEVGEN
jgi:hypothetical protein